MKLRHYVYVIELNPRVWSEPKFRKSNTEYVPGSPCVYVGMTALDPDLRFDQHKAGIRANRFARDYGERLAWDWMGELKQPMSAQDARYNEVDFAIRLRKLGWAVWQA